MRKDKKIDKDGRNSRGPIFIFLLRTGLSFVVSVRGSLFGAAGPSPSLLDVHWSGSENKTYFAEATSSFVTTTLIGAALAHKLRAH